MPILEIIKSGSTMQKAYNSYLNSPGDNMDVVETASEIRHKTQPITVAVAEGVLMPIKSPALSSAILNLANLTAAAIGKIKAGSASQNKF